MWKRIKKTFYHHLIKKNIRPSDVFFSYDPIFGTLFDQLFPAISIQSSENPVQEGQTPDC